MGRRRAAETVLVLPIHPVRRHGDRNTFEIPDVAPGTYRFVSCGKLVWTANDLLVPTSGLADARVILRPDVKQVKALAKKKKKKKKN